MVKHSLLALAMQIAVWFLTKDMWLGAVAGSMFFMGREVAQNEYRWMKANGTNRDTTPWYIGFTPEAWHAKAVQDAFVPAIIVFGLAYTDIFNNFGSLGFGTWDIFDKIKGLIG